MTEYNDQKGYLRFAINLGNPVLTTLLPDGSPETMFSSDV